MPERSSVIEPYLRVSKVDVAASGAVARIRRPVIPGELLNLETVATLAALILLSRLRLMGELAPFGLAYWAVAARGEQRRMLLYGMVMVAAAALGGSSLYGATLLLSAVLFYSLHHRLDKPRLPISLAVGTALFCGSLPQLWINSFFTYDIVLLLLETGLAMLAVAVFLQVQKNPADVLLDGRNLEALTSWIVFAGLLLLSLVQAGSWLTYLASGVARVIVLWASFAFGPGLAAAAGALLGFLLGMQGAGFVWLGILTFAGFLAGMFRPYGRLATAAGFLLASAALCLYTTGWKTVPQEMAVTASATIFFLLGPVLPVRFQALAPFFPQSADDEVKKVRDLTAVRIRDYALVFRELAETFQSSAALEKEKEPAMTSLVEAVVERVCKFCPSRRRCWEKDVQRTYNAMLRVLAELDGAESGREPKSPEFFQKICRRKEDFLKTVAMIHERETYQRSCNKKMEEGRTLVTMQLAGLSQIMLDLAREVRDGVPDARKRLQSRYFHVEIGVAQAAKGNAEVCGDYYSYLELRDGKQAFIVSDGMGNGSRAHQESRSAVQLVEQLLLAGFRKDAVVRTVNTILQLRSSDESFATLDVLLVDAENGEAEFLKIGAAPSYLRLQDKVREVKSPSIPLGILDDVELRPVVVQLEDNALIVMVTDGIFEVLPAQPDWLKKYLAGKLQSHPQVLADEIIHQARSLCGREELRDDVTVLVCRAKRLKHKIRDFVARPSS